MCMKLPSSAATDNYENGQEREREGEEEREREGEEGEEGEGRVAGSEG